MKQAINFLPILPYTPYKHDRREIKRNAYLASRCFFTTPVSGSGSGFDNTSVRRKYKRLRPAGGRADPCVQIAQML
jgi:hypothetical protein